MRGSATFIFGEERRRAGASTRDGRMSGRQHRIRFRQDAKIIGGRPTDGTEVSVCDVSLATARFFGRRQLELTALAHNDESLDNIRFTAVPSP